MCIKHQGISPRLESPDFNNEKLSNGGASPKSDVLTNAITKTSLIVEARLPVTSLI